MYPTTSIKSSPNRTIFEIDQLSDIINVSISAVREHSSATGKKEPITVVPDPILNSFFHRQFTVRHISIPSSISTSRPREGIPVTIRRRNSTLQILFSFQRTVSLSKNQSVTFISQRSLRIFARRVFCEIRGAAREGSGCGRGYWFHGGGVVVGLKIEGTFGSLEVAC